MGTVHNAANKGDIAKVVLMCGDPLRVKYIAENYLENPKLVNEVRNMYCYTGTYKGKEISVMGSGMGVPSIAIYSHELYTYYDVDTIIRVGTCGGYTEDVHVRDVVVATGACTDSNYASQLELNGIYSAIADFGLLRLTDEVCKEKGVHAHFGNILTSDCFYRENPNIYHKWVKLGVLAVEMESYALYLNAAKFNKKAMTILTVSDNLATKEETSPAERQQGFNDAIEVALEVARRA